MRSGLSRLQAWVVASYLVVAVAQAWPLALHLSTHLTGPPGGDTGVYVWNIWVFRHEVENGHLPLSTDAILPLAGRRDLSLHNYTVFADVLAFPLLSLFNVITAFNLVYIVNAALAGWGMFLLARRVTGRTAEAWIAGFLFACSPFLVARSTAHFSLAAAAPLPFFLYWLDRAWESLRLRDAALVGLMAAWAAYSDPVLCRLLPDARHRVCRKSLPDRAAFAQAPTPIESSL